MRNVRSLSPQFAVCDAAHPEAVASLRGQGFKVLLNFRPDAEAEGQPASRDLFEAARAAGLTYHHLPVVKYVGLTPDVVARAAAILATADGPVIATCASGQRAALVWAAIEASAAPIGEVLERLSRAGLDLTSFTDDIETHARAVRPARSAA